MIVSLFLEVAVPSLRKFDATRYMRKSKTACEQLYNQDSINTKKRAETFAELLFELKNKEKIHNAIFAIIASMGGGKTFFLATLYCHLHLNIKVNVFYVDTFEYAMTGGISNLREQIVLYCNRGDQTILLLDNLDKHSAKFILETTFLLDRMSDEENVLFVLSYDDQIIQEKLGELFGKGGISQHFFQRYIDYEFFLHYPAESYEALSKTYAPHVPLAPEFTAFFIKRFQDFLSFTQIESVLKKFNFYLQNNPDILSPGKTDGVIAFLLLVIKAIDKAVYRELLSIRGSVTISRLLSVVDQKDSRLEEKLSDAIGSIEINFKMFQIDYDSDLKPILNKMELTDGV